MPAADDRQHLLPSGPSFASHPYAAAPPMASIDSPGPSAHRSRKFTVLQVASYVLDWIVIIAVGVVGTVIGNISPNMRHFSLDDLNISFPFTEHETVTSTWLLLTIGVFPAAIILIVALIFVPGSNVPRGTPTKLIWKRKLWEWHTGWLGLALALCCAWIITSGMKNLFGKPRPDLLSRCIPDSANWVDHIAGFYNPPRDGTYRGQLVKASICTTTDKDLLDDGFRSYPSGHASSAAAGLIYLSFFLASKFALTIPFVPLDSQAAAAAASSTAFPSRVRNHSTTSHNDGYGHAAASEEFASSADPALARRIDMHNSHVTAVRRQAAAPPVYLLLLAILPTFTAVFIASSRWFDFRHHGFDILFGFIIGTVCAWFSFRFYHLPLRSGAGWAWGPRSHDKAFWAGVGSYSYATSKKDWETPRDEEDTMGPGNDIELTHRKQSPSPMRAGSSATVLTDRG